MVRELEKDAAAAAKAAAVAAAGREVTHYMRRALSSFDTRAVLFVDICSDAPWQALHSNSALAQVGVGDDRPHWPSAVCTLSEESQLPAVWT